MAEEERWFDNEFSEVYSEELAELLHFEESNVQKLQYCSFGVLSSLHTLLFRMLFCATLKRLLIIFHTKGIISEDTLHLTVIASGLFMMWTQNTFALSVFSFTALVIVVPYYKFLFKKNIKFKILIYSIGMLLIWQCLMTAEKFMSIRGILMVMLMKTTSVSFDLANELYKDISLLQLLSYVLDGSTILFGPWITYKQYHDSLEMKNVEVEIMNCFRALSYILFSLLAVIYSSCVADNFTEWYFVGAYFVAQSFRFSHYFVCWLSAGISLLSGVDSGSIVDWTRIELPRSLVDVVVSWNIPMHQFLHQYVFGEMRKYGSAIAIFATYVGINFQLSAVLLSLGFYTYAETKLRSRLSRRTNSCVRAKKCHEECSHAWKENSMPTLAVNMIFRIVAIIHLVYLGMAFDNSTAETGYSWNHTLNVWGDSYYFSHSIGTLTLISSFII
ncbi:unnamed protein product [Thelazia callipaeda]|uniref:Protein-serine O-palmitoleoyltransferase porcupine n=1 Tax=Thelazia callipaeda TaxID=103827 RepID=A0A0N5CXJ4_THECL|nr:unnamed protein product [Thelazia callipaeda]